MDFLDNTPTVGIVGFGAFGRLMARHLSGHLAVRACDPSLSEGQVVEGAAVAGLPEVAGCDIVVLATPVSAFAAAVAAIAPHLRDGALVVDVGSVKVGPAAILGSGLPERVDILGTHPLFGPQSARDGIAGHKIALCPIRGTQWRRLAAFLRGRLGLQVIVTTPEAHDREAATVQGLTHLIAKVLVRMEPLPTRMTTASFDMLRRAVDMVRHDAPEVFLAIEQANPYAPDVRRRFFRLAADLQAELDGSGAREAA